MKKWFEQFPEFWAEKTLLNKALRIASENAGKGGKFKDCPLWVRLRFELWNWYFYISHPKQLWIEYKIKQFHRKFY